MNFPAKFYPYRYHFAAAFVIALIGFWYWWRNRQRQGFNPTNAQNKSVSGYNTGVWVQGKECFYFEKFNPSVSLGGGMVATPSKCQTKEERISYLEALIANSQNGLSSTERAEIKKELNEIQ